MDLSRASIAALLLCSSASPALARWHVDGDMTECRASSGEGISFKIDGSGEASLFLHGNEGFSRESGYIPVRLVFDNQGSVEAKIFIGPSGGLGIASLTPELLDLITRASWLSVEKGEEVLAGYDLTGSAHARRRFAECLHRMTGGAYRRQRF